MAQLFPAAILENSTFSWLPRVTVRGQLMYALLLTAVCAGIVSLFYIKVDVSLNAPGLVRPVAEKTEVRSPSAGTIAEVLVTDGSAVRQGQVLLRLRQEVTGSKLAQTDYDLGEHEKYIHDLSVLTRGGGPGELASAQYRGQYARYQSQLAEQRTTLSKLRTEVTTDRTLLNEKVIAPKEFQDKQYEYDKALAAYQSTIDQQRSDWEEQLGRMRMEAGGLGADASALKQEESASLIRAPLSGTLQQFDGRSAGGYVQAGEILGIVSPDSNIVAECYVSPRDIGYLHPGMTVRCQVDAFNYNDWGVVQGKVVSIGNDFIIQDAKPVFKVRCSFAKTYLEMRGGPRGSLKKGMTLQARFLLTRRTLYQLLYDRTSDWLKS
ncbi:MAG TPA: HlyD family efflux transporter periplasmic adaptor subunit [Dinghuibacter sp.]|jgi:HlyD family secretion protein|uniref:HlyD family secretion protein n=1 Tax=Dinghuibacter sp. TaxID=2024697 RepID=UPI002C88AC27|nr:HlyD family efflux transporter periplasmic adaptor subunit [Dinghuibacter sp.]HTJ10587.1 HlyD family efflux transporter periplasmic adaptor subunit [Dinghuibacter sp.]